MDFPVRVYYEDTDAGGVVYHANYICFFERARTEFLRQAGFSQATLLEENIAFVVKNISIDYKSPARLDDLLTIKTTIAEFKRASMVFKQQLWKENNCLSEAVVTVACVNLTLMKPVAIAQPILQSLQAVEKT